MKMKDNKNSTVSHFPLLVMPLKQLGRTPTHWAVIAHHLRSAMSSTLRSLQPKRRSTIKAVINWQNMSTWKQHKTQIFHSFG